MSTVIEKHRLLVERLYKKTYDRALQWNYDQSTDLYSTSVAGKPISIESVFGDSHLITVCIYSTEGETIEKFNDEEITGSAPVIGNFPGYYSLMFALIELIKRQISGVDNILDELLHNLE